jgi:hypothetical protein
MTCGGASRSRTLGNLRMRHDQVRIVVRRSIRECRAQQSFRLERRRVDVFVWTYVFGLLGACSFIVGDRVWRTENRRDAGTEITDDLQVCILTFVVHLIAYLHLCTALSRDPSAAALSTISFSGWPGGAAAQAITPPSQCVYSTHIRLHAVPLDTNPSARGAASSKKPHRRKGEAQGGRRRMLRRPVRSSYPRNRE